MVPDRDQAALLELDDRAAALSIRRLGYLGRRPLELRHTVIRADRFTVSARFSATEGYTFVPAEALAMN